MFTVHFYMLIFSSMISLFKAFLIFIDGLVEDYSKATNEFDKLFSTTRKTNSDQLNDTTNIRLEVKKYLKQSIELHIGILK